MGNQNQFVILDLSGRCAEKRKQVFSNSEIIQAGLSLRFLEISAEQSEQFANDPKSLLLSKSFSEPVSAILLSASVSDSLLESATVISEEVKEMGFVDSVLLQNSKYWLRCFFAQALRQAIIDQHPTLNTHQTAFVTDGGALTHLCCSLLMQMGYKNLVILSEDVEQAESKFKSTQAKYFGSQISYLPFEKLTEQPSQGSILINLLDPAVKTDLYNDLLYLNFLKRDSLVVDLVADQAKSALTEESEVAGVHSFTGLLVLAHRDYYLLEHITQSRMGLSQDKFCQLYFA